MAKLLQLLCYVRFIGNDKIEEEMLFCIQLKTTTTAADIHDVLLKFFRDNHMDWDKQLVGVCTDGAPAMLRCRSGLVTRLQETAKNFISTHCVIHREALASKILSV